MTGSRGLGEGEEVHNFQQSQQSWQDGYHFGEVESSDHDDDNRPTSPSDLQGTLVTALSHKEGGSLEWQDNGHSDNPLCDATTTFKAEQAVTALSKEEVVTSLPELSHTRSAVSRDSSDGDSVHENDKNSLLPPMSQNLATNGGRQPYQDYCCGECQADPCVCFGQSLGLAPNARHDNDNVQEERYNNQDIDIHDRTTRRRLFQLERENLILKSTVETLNRKFEQMDTRVLRTNRRSLMLQSRVERHSQENEEEGPEPTSFKDRGLFVSLANLMSRRRPVRTKMDALPQDSFSFMAVAPLFSIPFVSAITLFGIQISAFLLLAINMIDLTVFDNPFGIPVNVKGVVRLTQLVALTITVLTQDDIRTGLNQINNGYNHETIGKAFPGGASYPKWMFSVVARCFEGSLSLIVTFFLIVTSGNVLDLLLNFTAMEFVSQLDELFFKLAEQGFVGKRNMLQADVISQTTYSVTKRRCRVSPFLLLTVTMIIMITAWSFLVARQTNGGFLCDTIFVQFGDDFVPALGAFSGLYTREPGFTRMFSNARARYFEKTSSKAWFEYCAELRAWTFTYDMREGDDQPDAAKSSGKCQWRAKSAETETFEILDMAHSVWYVRNGAGMEIQLDRFLIQCYDCDQMEGFECNGRGTCLDGACTCVDGSFGLRCEHSPPCSTLAMDSRYDGFRGTRAWSDSFDLLRNDTDQHAVLVYDRPVYATEYAPGKFDILLYTGRRWIATTSTYFNVSFDSENPTKALTDYLTNGFHAFWSDVYAVFLSSPTDVSTPSDVGTPIGLEWFHAKTLNGVEGQDLQAADVSAGSLDARLLCTVCGETNPCFFDADCVDGACQCLFGGGGNLCQIPPVGNGHCDPSFNTPEFDYDGGDCCEATCVSTRDASCGKDQSGFVDVGYYFCHLPVQVWYSHGKPIDGEPYTQLGASVALSANGRILVVGEPAADQVRIYDNDGSYWRVRDHPMTGPRGSRFGSFVAVSAGVRDIVSNPVAHSSISVVVAAPESKFVRIYECTTNGCSQSGEDFHGVVADISSDGTTVVVGTETNFTVYQRKIDYSWTAVTTKSGFELIYSIVLSGNGKSIGVGSLDYNVTVTSDDGLFEGVDRKSILHFDGQNLSPKGNTITSRINFSEKFEALRFSKIGNVAFYRKSMAISEDGNTLAVGATTSLVDTGVQAYVFDETHGWTKQGGNVSSSDGAKLDGRSFSLSANGRLVIGTAVIDGQDSGGILAFGWSGTAWEQQGESMPSGEDSSLAMSNDGSVLAVGLPFFNNNMAGSCFVYRFLPEHCPNGTVLLRLSLTLDEFPADTAWDLVSNETGEVIMSGGDYSHLYEQATVVDEVCLPKYDSCTIFSIYDRVDTRFASIGRYSNGMDPPGLYSLMYEGSPVAPARLTGSAERVYLGDCSTTCPEENKRFSVLVRTCLAFSWEIQNNITGATLMQDEDPAYCAHGVESERNKWKEVCIPLDGCLSVSIRANSGQPDFLNQTGTFDPYESGNNFGPVLRGGNATDVPVTQMKAGDVATVGVSGSGMRQLLLSSVNLLFYVYLDGVEISRGAIALQPGGAPLTFPVGNCSIA